METEALQEEIDCLCKSKRELTEQVLMFKSECQKLQKLLRKEKVNTAKLHDLCAMQMELLTEFEKTA